MNDFQTLSDGSLDYVCGGGSSGSGNGGSGGRGANAPGGGGGGYRPDFPAMTRAPHMGFDAVQQYPSGDSGGGGGNGGALGEGLHELPKVV